MSPLLWIALITIPALTVGLAVFAYLRARAREAAAPVRAHIASQSAPVAVAEEVRAIGEQIERAMAEQRVQGETQRQLMAQKLDSVRQSVDGQRTQVDGLRSELRHEVQRRDAELDEIRQQLGAIARGGALPAAARPALPAAPEPPRETASAPMIEETTFAPSPLSSAPDTPFDAPPAEPPTAPPAEPDLSFSEETFAEPAFEDASVDRPEAEPASAPEGPAFEEPSFEEPSFEEPSFEEPSFEEPSFETEPAAPDADPFAALSFEAPDPEGAPDDPSSVEQAPFEESSFEESSFEESSFEETPFEEASFEDVLAMSPAPPAPSVHDVRVASPSPAPADDAFAAASLHIGGDSAPAGDAFDKWTPEAVTPVEAPAVTPVADAPASEPHGQALQPSSPEGAWVARPGRPHGPDAVPQTASMDDFVFPTAETPPEPTPEPTAAPETGLIDLDALAAPSEPDAVPTTDVDATPLADAAPEPAADVAPEPAEAGLAEGAAPEAAPIPDGAEDLTVISTIDDDMQRLLYLEGVLTLEEIAQWGRGEARRISTRVSVSEETIMNQWVFEAQAALFSRYSKQAG